MPYSAVDAVGTTDSTVTSLLRNRWHDRYFSNKSPKLPSRFDARTAEICQTADRPAGYADTRNPTGNTGRFLWELGTMKFAICQEVFEGWDWERQCRISAEIGYRGLEVAPFTLAGSPRDVSPSRRRELRQIAAHYGLEIIGIHWLLAKTQGLHLTADDAAARRRAGEYLEELGDLCADLGGTVMVFGSPAQRSLQPGVTRELAMERATEVFRAAMPRIADRGVHLLIEPLTTKETDFINSCAEGLEIIERVGHRNFALHQDVKAMLGEGNPLPELIRRFAAVTRHFHVNDSNLLGPGMGETDYVPIFQALRDSGYGDWVSVEVFDYTPGAEHIAATSLRNMRETLARIATPAER